MPDITIIRGDSYAIRRPLYTFEFVDEFGAPFNLAGCTVRTTYKSQIGPIDVDPDDQLAPVRHSITIDLNGVATPNGLYLKGPASAGVVVDRITSSESKEFQTDLMYISDVQITDANDEVFTWIFQDGIRAIDAVTNRDDSR